jgi:hypothetical protein
MDSLLQTSQQYYYCYGSASQSTQRCAAVHASYNRSGYGSRWLEASVYTSLLGAISCEGNVVTALDTLQPLTAVRAECFGCTPAYSNSTRGRWR